MKILKIALISALSLTMLSNISLSNTAEEHLERGISLCDSGLIDEGIKEFKKAVEIAPYYAYAYYNWGVALGNLGRHEEAI